MFDGSRARGERELQGRLCAEGGVLKFKRLRRLSIGWRRLGEEGLRDDEIVFTWVEGGGGSGRLK